MPGKRVTIQGVRRLPDEPMVEPSCEDAMGKGATRSRHPESESISRSMVLLRVRCYRGVKPMLAWSVGYHIGADINIGGGRSMML